MKFSTLFSQLTSIAERKIIFIDIIKKMLFSFIIFLFIPLNLFAGTKFILDVSSESALENNSSAISTLTFTVTISDPVPAGQTLTIEYITDNIDAIAGDDYTLANGTLSFTDTGLTSQTFTVDTIGDDFREDNETFNVNLINYTVTGPGNSIEPETKGSNFVGTGTILNDDLNIVPRITIGNAYMIEGDVSTMDFNITLDNNSTSAVHIDYATHESNASVSKAVEGVDYDQTLGTLIFTPGQQTQTISVPINDDTLIEGNEYFYLNLLSVTTGNAVIDNYQGIGTIIDNDDNVTSACSPYIGKLVLNEYNDIPTVKNELGNTVPGLGTFIELKRLDLDFQPNPEQNWTVTIYDKNNATSADFTFAERDLACGIETPYIVFDLASNEIHSEGTVIIRDEFGREVDVLYVGGSNYFPSLCLAEGGEFEYDIDFQSSAQNKDIFRRPDGTGDWTDNGSGANSGATRCISVAGDTIGFLDAMNRTIANYSDGQRNITTKIVDKDIELKAVSIESGTLKDVNLTVAVWMAYNISGNTYEIDYFLQELTFNNNALVDMNAFDQNTSRNQKIAFKYCEDEYGIIDPDWKSCWQDVTRLGEAKISYSSDNYAIRPEKFNLTTLETHYPDLLRAGQNYAVNLTATNYGSATATAGYNQIGNNLDTNTTQWLNTTPYTLNDTTATLPYSADANLSSSFTFTDGISSSGANIEYADVGYLTLKIEDSDWASIDNDDTTITCDENGTKICSNDINVTFIPHHFGFEDTNVSNNNGLPGTFTYIADLNNTNFNMAARVQVKILAQNESNGTTLNFTSGAAFYENNISVSIDANDSIHGVANTTIINNILLGFGTNGDTNGTKTINWDDNTTNQVLRFNFARDVNRTMNPFLINASDVNISSISTYTGTAPSSPADINGTLDALEDGNTTFIYGRTHAGKQRYVGPTGNANIYYEFYCFTPDSQGLACNPILLNTLSPTLEQTNDMRWFINKNHLISRDGNITATTVMEKAPNNYVTEDFPNRNENIAYISTVKLDYNATTSGYPYTTTMENNASNWLIENKDDINAVKNYFQVRFDNNSTGWAGEHETDTTTKNPGTVTTNRRSMW